MSGHLDKITVLESQLKESIGVKEDVSSLREQLENTKREMEAVLTVRNQSNHAESDGDFDDVDDDDDARSVTTIVEDDAAVRRQRERRHSPRGHAHLDIPKPVTPEPSAGDEDLHGDDGQPVIVPPSHGIDSEEESPSNAQLVAQINSLASDLAEAIQSSRSLQAQHSESMSVIKQLTERVGALESGISVRVSEEVTKTEQRWEIWRAKFEDNWRKERESWDAERERLRGVVREWEEASRRAHEEEEDRELNERLSEEYTDEEDDADDAPEDWPDIKPIPNALPPLSPSRTKGKRRRPSSRGILAVRALKSVVERPGATTPKPGPTALADPAPVDEQSRTRENRSQPRAKFPGRTGMPDDPHGTEKESSESGRDSGDTAKGDEMTKRKSRRGNKRQMAQVSLASERGVNRQSG